MTTAGAAAAQPPPLAPPPTPPPAAARIPTPRPNKPSRTSVLQTEPTSAPKPRPNQSAASTPSTAAENAQSQAGEQAEGGQAPGQAPGLRRPPRTAAAADPLSDKATVFLIRRILCPQQPDKGRSSPAAIEHLLPPLTSRNDVDLQLYALIAIILREFVQNWYAKITPDEAFVAEIVQIIAHITRALEQRLRKVDLESLLFDELPELLDRHVTAYRAAHDPITQPPVSPDPREIYHSLCPLPALSPVPRPEDPQTVAAQAENEAAYRQLLAHAFLAILLPTEDLENGCLTTLVGQILSELIIGNAVANRLSEPWLIWELLIIASRTAGRQKTTEDGKRLGKPNSASPGRRTLLSVQALGWSLLQWCFLAVSFIRTAFAILLASGSLPPRTSHGVVFPKSTTRHGTSPLTSPSSSTNAGPGPSKTPVLAFRTWSAISNLAEMDRRMPWLCGASSMLQWIAVMGPGRIAGVDGKLDRLLSHGIHRYVLDAANLPPLLRTVRGALFPNNMPAGKPTLVAPSSDAGLRGLRRRCASALWALVPKGVGRLYFSGGLVRANPVSRARDDKTEGSAQLKTASNDKGKGEGSSLDDSGRDQGPWAPSDEGDERGKARRIETAATTTTTARARGGASAQAGGPAPPPPPPARGQEQPSSGSRSRRSAPAPRPKSGGQGSLFPDASARPSTTAAGHGSGAGAGREASVSGGMAWSRLTQGDEKGHGHGHGHGPGMGQGQGAGQDRACDRDGEEDDDAGDDPNDDGEILEEIERGILDVFGDAYCNKHLVYGMLELILVRLLPEMTEKGVLELLAERVPVEG